MKSSELIAACRELRKNPTKAEAILWVRLRNRQLLGYKFRWQHPVVGFILDFYCPEANLAIEVDGANHKGKVAQEYDSYRDQVMQDLGIHVLRFWNSEVENDPERVLILISEAIGERPDSTAIP